MIDSGFLREFAAVIPILAWDTAVYALFVLLGLHLVVLPLDWLPFHWLPSKMAEYMQYQMQKQMQQRMCEPLYDAIEEGDYKRGIKLASSKNLRGITLALALKGYCHACNKEMSEALEVARECMAAYPVDEQTLSVIQHCLRICNKEEELGPFYETLYSKYPGNPPILAIMFNFYVRIGDGKKMQNTAQKLYKITNDSKFQFWSVASMLQQTELPPMMLTIAEKTVAKLFFPPSGDPAAVANDASVVQPGAEEIELYLEILLRQNKIDQALSALDTLYGRPTGLGKGIKDDTTFKENTSIVKMHEMRYRMLKVDLCTMLVTSGSIDAARVKELVAAVKSEHDTLLQSYPDQWSSHQQLAYIAVTGALQEQGGAYGEGLSIPDDGASSLVAHRGFLVQIMSKHTSLRGPYLAEILLLVLWINLSAPSGVTGSLPAEWTVTPLPRDFPPMNKEGLGDAGLCLVGLICAYIDRFQSKQCCFGDIKDKIDFLAAKIGGQAAGVKWLDGLSTWALTRATEIEEDLRRHIAESGGSGSGSNVTAKVAGEQGAEKGKEKEKPGREECIKMVCSMAVMGQVACYASHHISLASSIASTAAPSLPSASAQGQTNKTDMRRLQLHLLTKTFCAGGVGGEKEVQPADEVLLLASPSRRKQYAQTGGSGSGSGGDGDGGEGASISAEWATVIAAGVSASPYSHCFKLDLLEPLRNLAAGKHALSMFEALGVKHVQNDSMSYLVLPLLMESGLFTEAHRQLIQVVNFHVKAGKDTGEMIGKSFEQSNYSKGLEMKRFHLLCQSSLQLALAKAELPLIELLENGKYSEVEAAAQYLEGCAEGGAEGKHDAPLFMALIDDEEMMRLSDNCDYGVVVRCDSTVEQEESFASARRSDAESRIREAQLALHLLSATLNAEPRKAVEKLARLRSHMEQTGVPVVPLPSPEADVTAFVAVVNDKVSSLLSEAQHAGRVEMVAHQALRSGGLRITLCLNTAIHDCFLFSSACATTLEILLALDDLDATGQEDMLVKGKAKADLVRQQAAQLVVVLTALKDCLTADKALYDSIRTKKGDVKVLSAAGLNALSAFTRTLGRWMPLVLKAGLKSFPVTDSDSDGNDASAGVDDIKATYGRLLGRVGRDIRTVASCARDMIQAVRTALGALESQAKSYHRLRPNPLFELESLMHEARTLSVSEEAEAGAQKEGLAASTEASELVEKCRVTLAKDVQDSHALSCSRLLTYLDTAVQILG